MAQPAKLNYPRRQKFDRLLNPAVSSEELTCSYAVAPFDEAALAQDRKWGIDRLPTLVSVETARKYGAALGQLNAAIEAGDPEMVAHKAGVCVRGLAAMDAEAEAAGAPKADARVIEYDLDGWVIGIMADDRAWQAIQAVRPDLKLFSLREVALALKAVNTPAVNAVKEAFPGARMTAVNAKPPVNYALGGDEIPW